MSGIENKDRNYHLIRTAKSMLERQMPPASVLTAIEDENMRYCNPPLSRQDLIYLIQNTQTEVEQAEALRAETVRSHNLRQEMIRQKKETKYYEVDDGSQQ